MIIAGGRTGEDMHSFISLAISIGIGVIGQLSLKAGTMRLSAAPSIGAMLMDLYVLLGLVAYSVAAVFYIQALKQIPLSVAFPSVSVSYAVVAFASHWLWGEMLGLRQIAALFFISLGIYLLARG